MGLFGFGKRKEEGGKTVACACKELVKRMRPRL